MTLCSLIFQCLVNVLRSLVDWEKLCREFGKKIKRVQSLEEEVSPGEFVEIKIREDVSNNFEKAKAHKSTMEAAIGEVIILCYFYNCDPIEL